MNQWERNIRKLYLFKIFTVFYITNPILMFYMLERGLSVGDIFLLSAIQRVVGIILEIPTGALSDFKGHRYNLMLGTISFSFCCICFAYAETFFGFLIAEIFIALAVAFISGADTALVYETLEMNHSEDQYEKIFGRMRSVQFGVNAVVILAAGFLAQISWKLPFWIAAIFSLIAFGISYTLVEPYKESKLSNANKLSGAQRYHEYFKTIKTACKIAYTNVEIRWFLIFASLLSLGLVVVQDFYQVYMRDALQSPVYKSGVIYFILFIWSGIFSNYTAAGLKKIGYNRMFYLLPVLGVIAAAGMVLFSHQLVYILFLLPYISTSFMPTLISGYLNRRTDPGQRATIVSLRQVLRKLANALTTPFIGWGCDLWGMQAALLMAIGILFVTMLIPLVYKQKYNLRYDYAHGAVAETSAR